MENNSVTADKFRWGKRKYLLLLPQFRFIWLKRKCEIYRNNKVLFIFFRVIYEHYKIKYMMDIPASVQIGPGFKIEHIGGIVINPFTKIGSNVNILNGVLIGQQNRGNNKGYPTIGNEVWIGANSIIVGNISIGNNILIAPGSYVNFDVPNNSIVIGNPGKIIPCKHATQGYVLNIYDNRMKN